MRALKLDVFAGAFVANLVTWAILVTAAATLHAKGVTTVETAAQAAEALRPAAGPLAYALFALGILAVGLLAVPVLAGGVAYAVGEAMGAVDCPSIGFCTASEKEPDMPDMVYLEEKARAGYCGEVASLRPRDSKRMKLHNANVREVAAMDDSEAY